MTKQKPLYLFHLLALCIVCVWGTTFVSTKTLISNGLTPTEIFIYRFALAYICVLFMAPRRLFADMFADEMRMIAAGLTGGSVYFITENTALGMMQATNVAILISVTPLLATLVGMAVFRSERTKRPERVILGSVVAMAGVVVILWNGGDFAAFNPCGTALTFSAALSWAVYSLFVKKLSQRYDNVFISRKVFGYGLLSMAVWVPFFHPVSFRLEQLLVPTVFFNILFLGLVASMLCFTLWNAVVRHLGMVRASNYINFNAVATFVAAFLILGEHVSAVALVGSAAVIFGVWLAEGK